MLAERAAVSAKSYFQGSWPASIEPARSYIIIVTSRPAHTTYQWRSPSDPLFASLSCPRQLNCFLCPPPPPQTHHRHASPDCIDQVVCSYLARSCNLPSYYRMVRMQIRVTFCLWSYDRGHAFIIFHILLYVFQMVFLSCAQDIDGQCWYCSCFNNREIIMSESKDGLRRKL